MTFVANDYKPGDFRLVFDGVIADIYTDREEYPGVKRALMDLRDDIHRVTGCLPKVKTDQDLTHETVIVGTIGKSPLIDSLIAAGRLDALEIKGRWEAHVVQVVPNPLPNVGLGLVVAGSDKRGTIYGVYEISRQIGVSPWYWWADVTPAPRKALVIRSGVYKRKEPSVKHRGSFNNEWPSLGVWAHGKFGGFNHFVLQLSFRAILRLKGNLLWPAM